MPTMTWRNNELAQLLASDFQRRYEPNFAWVNACAGISALPGLRGFWTLGTFDSNGNAIDHSGHGHTLTAIGEEPKLLYNYYMLRPYVMLDGANNYLRRTDEADLDITGTETYVTVSRQGITLGGWFYADTLPTPGNTYGLMTKWNLGVSQSYEMHITNGGVIVATIEDAGGIQNTAFTTSTVAADQWFFAAFTWSGTNSITSMSIWVSDLDEPDGLHRNDFVPTRANIRNGTADFCIGGYHGGARLLDGYASMCWLSAMTLNGWDAVLAEPIDALVWSVFQQTRAMYGV